MSTKKYCVSIRGKQIVGYFKPSSPHTFVDVPLDTPPAPPNTPIFDISENSALLKRLTKKKNNIFCCFGK